MSPHPPPPSLSLFKHYDTCSWTAVNDTLRGGASSSYLRPIHPSSTALFGGLLTSHPLGAGFASQSTRGTWDLSTYDGVEISVGAPNPQDVRTITLVLKNDLTLGETTFEFHFQPPVHRRFVAWEEFRPTRRGREVVDGPKLEAAEVRAVSWMARTFFAEQEGPFEVKVGPIVAVKRVDWCDADGLDDEMERARGVPGERWCEVDELDAAMEQDTQRKMREHDEKRRQLRCEIDALDASMQSPDGGSRGACCMIM